MKKSDYEKMMAELKNVFEPTIYGETSESVTLCFSIDCSEDTEEEQPSNDQLDEINAVLEKYEVEADWTGNGNGNDMDARCIVTIDGDYYITASFEDGNGVRVDCTQWETMGNSFGNKYHTEESAVLEAITLAAEIEESELDLSTQYHVMLDGRLSPVYTAMIDE